MSFHSSVYGVFANEKAINLLLLLILMNASVGVGYPMASGGVQGVYTPEVVESTALRLHPSPSGSSVDHLWYISCTPTSHGLTYL